MSKNRWDLEYAGAGSCSGEFISAEYEHTAEAGWVIQYLIDGQPITSSAAPRHPSLRMLAADAAGEKRVIKTAFAVIDSIEDSVTAKAARELGLRWPPSRKAARASRASAQRRAQA